MKTRTTITFINRKAETGQAIEQEYQVRTWKFVQLL